MADSDNCSQKEKFDALMKQAEYAFASFNGRRQYEWKVNFALWTVIVAAIGYLKGTPIPWWLGVLGAVVHGYFLWGISGANKNDKLMADHFRDQAARILCDPEYRVLKPPPRISSVYDHLCAFKNWAHLSQLIVTILLLMAAWWGLKPP
ncbi:MAG: hypothetical protein HY521_06270 [Proteobacteria bacterium]|nr:hypothetical protein [Pseudomonadota bacterium]